MDESTEAARRGSGDGRADLGEELERHVVFVRGLAASLTGDWQAAEDIAQDAALLALQRPPTRVEAMRGWLAKTARRLVHRRWRERERRRRREAAVARVEHVVGEDDDGGELLAALTRSVLALPEPYRHTVLRRFHGGATPRQIAAADGVALATVHSRLRRAMEQLRTNLDRERPGGRAAWLFGLVQLSGGHVTLPTTGAAAGPPALATNAVAAMTAKQTTLSAVAIAIAGILLTLLWLGWNTDVGVTNDPVGRRAAVSVATVGGEREGEPSVVSREQPLPIGRDPVATDAPIAPSGGDLEVVVTWHPDGQPAVERGFSVLCWGDAQPLRSLREVVTDESGRFVLRGLPEGPVAIYGHVSGGGGGTIEAGETSLVEISLPVGRDVTGRVIDAGDRPVAGAGLWLSDYGNYERGRVVARTDGDGRFRIRGVVAGHWLGALADHLQPSHLLDLDSTPDPIEFRLLIGGATLRGTVLSAQGEAIADAWVQIEPRPEGAELRDDNGRHAVRSGRVDAAGGFLFAGLPPGPCILSVRAGDEHAPSSEQLSLEPDGLTTRVVTLGIGCRLSCTVVDNAGQPVPGASLQQGPYGGFLSVFAKTDERGMVALAGLPAGSLLVEAEKKGVGQAKAELLLRPDETTRWQAVLDRGLTVHGRIVDGDGQLRRDGSVYLVSQQTREDGRSLWSETDPCEDGTFEFTSVPDAPFHLEVQNDAWPGLVVRDIRRPGPDGREIRIVIDSAELVPGRVHGVAVDANGYPLRPPFELTLVGSRVRRPVAVDESTGAFAVDGLFAGRYSLRVSGKELATTPIGRVEVAAGGDVDAGLLKVPATGRLLLRTAAVPGLHAPYEQLLLQHQRVLADGTTGPDGLPQQFAPGQCKPSLSLATGWWEWSAEGAGLVRQWGRFEIVADPPTTLALVPEAGHVARFAVRMPETAAGASRSLVRLQVRTTDGRAEQSSTVVPQAGEPALSEMWLRAGAHEVEAIEVVIGRGTTEESRRVGPVAFDVPVGGMTTPVELILR